MIFHKSLRFLGASVLLCALSLFPASSFAERGDILDYSSLGITPLSLEGSPLFVLEPEVRNIRWGMPPEMVIEREGITSYSEASRGELLYITLPRASILEIPCSITYIFPGNTLSGIFCSFHSDTLRLDKDIAHFSRLEALLEEKYGPPLEKRVTWDNPKSIYIENPDSFGMAVAMEDLRYHTEWHTGHTVINLRLEAENYRPALTLTYQSTFFQEKEREATRNVLFSEL